MLKRNLYQICQVDDEDEDDDDPNKTYDLIILGLPWKTTEDDIREYFEVSVFQSSFCEDDHFYDISTMQPFGEIHMIQLKKRPGSGESKGFGFIRFVDKEVEKKVRGGVHLPNFILDILGAPAASHD